MKLYCFKQGGSLSRVPFHNRGCFESMREDRNHGLIYSPFHLEGIGAVGHCEAAMILSFCAYCGIDQEWREEERARRAAGLSIMQTGTRHGMNKSVNIPKYLVGK